MRRSSPILPTTTSPALRPMRPAKPTGCPEEESASRRPHSPQNLTPGAFSKPQLEQRSEEPLMAPTSAPRLDSGCVEARNGACPGRRGRRRAAEGRGVRRGRRALPSTHVAGAAPSVPAARGTGPHRTDGAAAATLSGQEALSGSHWSLAYEL